MKKSIQEEALRRYPKNEQLSELIAFTEGAVWRDHIADVTKMVPVEERSCKGCKWIKTSGSKPPCNSCMNFGRYTPAPKSEKVKHPPVGGKY